jgi:prepilin-type N-terminal cleavage/methylation domain-containing protein
MSSKHRKPPGRQLVCRGQDGFSMIEVIIAILILTIALVATAAALTFALEFGAISKNVSSAKLVIVSSIEEIESLRNARRLEFKQIGNVGDVDNTNVANSFSGFSNGFQPVSINPGPDGVNGTPDDLTAPGADGRYGTDDDFSDDSLARTGYSRQITITNLPGSATIKKLEVRVRYFASAGKVGEIAGVAYINDEFRVTR